MFLSKLFKHTRARVMTALAGLTMVLGVGTTISTVAATQQSEVVETRAAAVSFSRFRLYNVPIADHSLPVTDFDSTSGYDNQLSWDNSISANTSNHVPASTYSSTAGTASTSDCHYVADYSFSGGYSSSIRWTFYGPDNDKHEGLNDRYVPTAGNQSKNDNSSKENNLINWNGSSNLGFSAGYIYKLHSLDKHGWNQGYNGNYNDPKDGNVWRCIRWFTYTLSTIGVFVHYDLDGGSFSDSHTVDEEHKINTGFTLPAAPTKAGYVFMGWQASTNGVLNRASTSFNVTQPMTFTAIWHSTSLTVIPGSSVRVWVAYDTTSGSVDNLMYAGAGKEMKLWIHQGNGSAGSAERVIAASGTYYANGESINGLLNCPRRYDYFDVPLSYVKAGYYVNLQRFSGGSCEKTSGQTTISSDSSHAFKVLYVDTKSGSDWNIKGYYGLDGSAPDSLFAAIALCGIHTCSSEVMNGYGGYSNYYSTFVQSGSVANGLSSYTISDYANGDTSYSGLRNKSTNAKTKYDWIQNGGENPSALIVSHGYNESPLTMTLWIVLGCGVAGLGAIATAYFISKKKKHQA